MLKVGPNAGKYAYILSAELYSALAESKVIEEAAMRSGISKGAIQAAWAACGDVIVAWATEGHSVPVPGLGTMRFGVNAQSVLDVNMVASSLITSRKIVFTPSVDVKAALKAELNIAIIIKIVEPHTIQRSEGKAVRIVDLRD